MNYYARYFDSEGVFPTPQALVDFIASIPQITMTEELSDAMFKFCADKTSFPRHFRLPNKSTFIVIKTNSSTLEEFKTRGANGGVMPSENREPRRLPADEIHPGVYNATMTFRRAVVNPRTHKCCFVDDTLQVEMNADSPRQCYEAMTDYLKNNPDVDTRSQFPSVRSNNFKVKVLGE